MRWIHPEFLYSGPLLLLLLGVLARFRKRRTAALLTSFAGEQKSSRWAESGSSPTHAKWDLLLTGGVLVCLVIALARPMIFLPGLRSEQQGAPYLIALDVSRSMLAPDVPPTRFSALTNALDSFFAESKGDRIGLISFSGVAYLNAPLTSDTFALRTILTYLNPIGTPDPGSSIASALDRATRYFTSNRIPSRTILIASDGEDLDPATISLARTLHRDHQLVIHTLGIGTVAGANIPAQRTPVGPTPPPGIDSGVSVPATVTTRLDEHSLQRIAQAGGGRYYRLGTRREGLEKFRAEVLQALATKEARKDLENYAEACGWPLGLAAILLFGRVWLATIQQVRKRPLPSILESEV